MKKNNIFIYYLLCQKCIFSIHTDSQTVAYLIFYRARTMCRLIRGYRTDRKSRKSAPNSKPFFAFELSNWRKIYIYIFFISSESQWLMDESEALSAYNDWLLWWKHSWNFLELLCLSQFVLRKKRDNFNHFCF